MFLSRYLRRFDWASYYNYLMCADLLTCPTKYLILKASCFSFSPTGIRLATVLAYNFSRVCCSSQLFNPMPDVQLDPPDTHLLVARHNMWTPLDVFNSHLAAIRAFLHRACPPERVPALGIVFSSCQRRHFSMYRRNHQLAMSADC